MNDERLSLVKTKRPIKKLAIERTTMSSLQVFKMVNRPPVIFVSFPTFVNLINFAPVMKILSLPSDFTTYLFSTPTVLYHCYNWYPIFLPLVCHTFCQLPLRNVQVLFHVLG